MKTTRKLMRKFIYVSVGGSTMGTMEIERITSEELPDWKVYQFTRNVQVRTELNDQYDTVTITTTETRCDFPTYNEALAYWGPIESQYVNDPEYRTDSPTHPNPPVSVQVQQTPINTLNKKENV